MLHKAQINGKFYTIGSESIANYMCSLSPRRLEIWHLLSNHQRGFYGNSRSQHNLNTNIA